MRRWLAIVLVLAVVPAVAFLLNVGAAVAASRAPELGLRDGWLLPCPPDVACVSSDANGAGAIAPLELDGSAEDGFRRLVELLRTEPCCDVVSVEEGYVHAVFWTPFVGLIDDVEFRLDADAGIIHVRAISRLGARDLETPRQRVETVRRRWLASQPAHSEAEPGYSASA